LFFLSRLTTHLFQPADETKLYIGNISFDTEIATLREVFEDYGPIVDLYLPTDQNTGRPRGFAFVTLEPENANRAIEEVDGWEVDGRMLRVNTAQPKGSGGNSEGYSNNQESYNNNEGTDEGGYSATNEW
jgi:RNA recognition motif-containing protein